MITMLPRPTIYYPFSLDGGAFTLKGKDGK